MMPKGQGFNLVILIASVMLIILGFMIDNDTSVIYLVAGSVYAAYTTIQLLFGED